MSDHLRRALASIRTAPVQNTDNTVATCINALEQVRTQLTTVTEPLGHALSGESLIERQRRMIHVSHTLTNIDNYITTEQIRLRETTSNNAAQNAVNQLKKKLRTVAHAPQPKLTSAMQADLLERVAQLQAVSNAINRQAETLITDSTRLLGAVAALPAQ